MDDQVEGAVSLEVKNKVGCGGVSFQTRTDASRLSSEDVRWELTATDSRRPDQHSDVKRWVE